MGSQQMKKMMNGAVILSVAAFIAKLLSAVYRVPFQNMVGNTGFYVYQQVYPIYGIGMTLAMSGFPVFLSKVVAESTTKKQQYHLIRRSFFLISLMCLLFFLVLFFLSNRIAGWMGDTALSPVIRTASGLFLLIPFLSIGRGYFQGTFRMLPTAVSQVTEQVVRVGVILATAFWYTKIQWNVYQMGTAAMSSSWIAGIVACILLGTVLFKEFQKDKRELMLSEGISAPAYRELIGRFATEGFTLSLMSAMLILLQLIDSFTVYKALQQSGLTAETAKELKGIYDRGQPLVQLGMVAATAFSASLVPSLSQAFVRKREKEFTRVAQSLIRITGTFALAATAGMMILMPLLNYLLFGDTDGSLVLQMYVWAVALASLISVYNAILQSRKQYGAALLGLGCGLFLKAVCNPWFISQWGILGSSLATIFSLSVILAVLWFGSPGSVKRRAWNGRKLLQLIGCCSFMMLAAWVTAQPLTYVTFRIESRTVALTAILAGAATGASVYIWLLMKLRLLTVREWLSLPFGKKLLRK